MGYLTLIKYAVIVAILTAIGFSIHQNGRKVERNDWLEKEQKRIKTQGEELRAAMQRVADRKKTDEMYNARIQNEYQNEINRLKSDRDHAHRLWLSVKKPNCNINTVRGETDNSAQRVDVTDQPGVREQARVSETVYTDEYGFNAGLEQVWEDLQQIKAHTKKVIALCEPRFEVVD